MTDAPVAWFAPVTEETIIIIIIMRERRNC